MQNTTFETPRSNKKREVFKTRFTDTLMVDDVARFEIQEMKRIFRNASNVEIPEVDQMKRYLKTMLWLRIQHTTEAKYSEYSTIARRVRVPARWYTLLVNIGQAHDYKRNFKFIPEFGMTKDDLMTPKELRDMSELLEMYNLDGYSTVPGIPKSFEGSLYLMAKTVMNETMMGMDSDNPIYAFLASILRAEVIHDTYGDLNMLFRVQYSSLDIYEMHFGEYFRGVDLERERSTGTAPRTNNVSPQDTGNN